MAYFQYLSEITGDCLTSSFQSILEEVGLSISEELSSHAQIFAEGQTNKPDYKSKVNVLISWSNKPLKECSIEVRSDEPLRKGTCCEKIANELRQLIPPNQPNNKLQL